MRVDLQESQIAFYHKLTRDYDRLVSAEAIEDDARYRSLFPLEASFAEA